MNDMPKNSGPGDFVKEESFSGLEERLFYRFGDRVILREALCHTSYANEHPGTGVSDNERLEFLGDAVLGLVAGHLLMLRYRDICEGELSRMRALLVCESTLADLAREMGLGKHLLLGRGESQARGHEKDSILAGSLEALIGAVFLDGGFSHAYRTIDALLSPLVSQVGDEVLSGDPKSTLQEFLQQAHAPAPVYTLVETSGPDHDKTFVVEAVCPGGLSARGTGKNKKAAEQDAARQALKILASGKSNQ
jgi:ribonuclease III